MHPVSVFYGIFNYHVLCSGRQQIYTNVLRQRLKDDNGCQTTTAARRQRGCQTTTAARRNGCQTITAARRQRLPDIVYTLQKMLKFYHTRVA